MKTTSLMRPISPSMKLPGAAYFVTSIHSGVSRRRRLWCGCTKATYVSPRRGMLSEASCSTPSLTVRGVDLSLVRGDGAGIVDVGRAALERGGLAVAEGRVARRCVQRVAGLVV